MRLPRLPGVLRGLALFLAPALGGCEGLLGGCDYAVAYTTLIVDVRYVPASSAPQDSVRIAVSNGTRGYVVAVKADSGRVSSWFFHEDQVIKGVWTVAVSLAGYSSWIRQVVTRDGGDCEPNKPTSITAQLVPL